MANGTKELYTSPITIEDEINEFSEKPVQGKTLYKKLKELEDSILPDTTEASAGDALVLDDAKNPTWASAGGGTIPPLAFVKWREASSKWYMDFYDIDDNIIQVNKIASGKYLVIECDDEMHTSCAYYLDFNQSTNRISLFSYAIDADEAFVYKKHLINATTGEHISVTQRKATLAWSDY